MNNYYAPCFNRNDFVVIPSYIELPWFKSWRSPAVTLHISLKIDPLKIDGLTRLNLITQTFNQSRIIIWSLIFNISIITTFHLTKSKNTLKY